MLIRLLLVVSCRPIRGVLCDVKSPVRSFFRYWNRSRFMSARISVCYVFLFRWQAFRFAVAYYFLPLGVCRDHRVVSVFTSPSACPPISRKICSGIAVVD